MTRSIPPRFGQTLHETYPGLFRMNTKENVTVNLF